MADGIQTLFFVKVIKDDETLVNREQERTTVVMDGQYASSEVQLIGTVAELLDIGADIAIEGFLVVKNIDNAAHNTIQLGTLSGTVFTPFAELHTGDPRCMIPIATLAIYARATLSPAKLQFDIFER